MGCGAQKQSQGLSPQLRQKALEIFKKIDVNNSGSIDKDETQKFWKTNFAKVNTQALFNAVDFDKSGQITEDEWMAFWEIVKKSGYSDKEIFEELDNLMEGKAWVQFRKVDEFVKRDQMRKKSQVKQIVEENSKRKSILQQEQHNN
ncbi:unnamed protein product (macronuclear) [Paramecium tetraurelia]|uniref:EF-hand domain-containing protein n=2 Tax=Paramecium TaxID=5884 RepID=A0CAP1_PARTE|nr:uncharacterized protein GSPATT00036639001 [Paramecium tetraurelia]CAD8209501.1 unnamed protein product [Paramecium octaurelia]CAK67858.1 unnamed protein product [Paramecium tetraurelia]|eukprot:XP_001435255.1 hypothetical protein (macronuclear) [Paramecium tetraurelia strain d4-2]